MNFESRFVYLGNRLYPGETSKGVITIAYAPVPSEATPKPSKIIIGLSFCSPKDRFIKAKARMIALGRMNNERSRVECLVQDDEPYYRAAMVAVNQLLFHRSEFIPSSEQVKGIPYWATKLRFELKEPKYEALLLNS